MHHLGHPPGRLVTVSRNGGGQSATLAICRGGQDLGGHLSHLGNLEGAQCQNFQPKILLACGAGLQDQGRRKSLDPGREEMPGAINTHVISN